jgi:hypothetical protein
MTEDARARFARRSKRLLARRLFLRLHMSLLLMATTVAGIGTSKLLLAAGLSGVRLRYPLAVLGSYLVFLGLLRLWIVYVVGLRVAWSKWRVGQIGGDGFLPDLSGGGVGNTSSSFAGFGGGSSGGGGASDSWGESVTSVAPKSGGGGGGSWLPDLDFDGDIDGKLVLVLLALALLIGMILGGGGYLIWAAPNILPDMAAGALLTSYVTRSAKKAQDEGWVRGALRSTGVPFLLVLITASGLAWAVHSACPQAERLAQVFACPDALR